MPDHICIRVDGVEHRVGAGTSVAAALWNAGVRAFRVSPSGAPRAPACGMGTCFECRVTIDGRPDTLSCQTPCREGMEVRTAHEA
ncbi:MAG: (2Fe-2S)-binding protein [Deltaproteobacteria bacterium]|nr:(2Fe-2S)-binding protein [Deltaproteobacteria bacterium]